MTLYNYTRSFSQTYMTSPYSTRSKRITQIQPHSHTLPNKSRKDRISPNTSTRLHTNTSNGMTVQVDDPTFLTPQTARNKKETVCSILSHQELLNFDHTSSHNNDSSVVRHMPVKHSTEVQFLNANISSLVQQPNSLFASLQQEKKESGCIEMLVKQKKSYRNICQYRVVGVPYRKCHSTMQEKVVNIINKINSGKDCEKQIDTLLERTRKITTKEMMNRYFVSGLQTLQRLISKSCKFSPNLLNQIEGCLAELLKKIQSQIDCPNAFCAHIQQPPTTKTLTISKQKMILRTFNILRKKLRVQAREKVQELAIETVTSFMESNCDMNQFIGQLCKC